MNTVIIGTQWGDEGKGKIIDFLAEDSDCIIRFQGGSNAGHTVVVDTQAHIFHLLPSGILHKGKICVIGNGVVVDPEILFKEIEAFKDKGYNINSRLKISSLSHIIFPYHKIMDVLREKRRIRRIGTTGRGIGPCYADKINRCGIRVIDLINPDVFSRKLKDNLKEKNEIFRKVYGFGGFSFNSIYKTYLDYGKAIKPYIIDVSRFLNEAIKKKKSLLFEGAQGTFLDIDFGTYPYVTSSTTTAGGAASGCGIAPTSIDKIIGVAKSYTTRVGEGPFPTELSKKFSEFMRKKGNEFGATTGRPRRCGWFDAVMVSTAASVNRVSELAITKLDVLGGLKKIKICIAYKYKGKMFRNYPYDDLDVLEKGRLIWQEYPSWQEDISTITEYRKLPKNTKVYIKAIQDLLRIKIFMISLGSQRNQTVRI
ncbi:MAG: adenylosuccinate synthase [Candidatus Omnitrophica bacterium]|nr:adenylosuccinate synthase [Candidatus Omnitrophota bacterium]